jgi:hypothetical protein
MSNASAKYVIAAEDRTKAAADSIKRNFKDIDGAARKIAGTLKGLGVVGIALKAWATAARLGDEAIKNLAASNKAFADSVRESETAMRSAFSAGQLTIEAQTKLTAAFNDPAYVAAMRQSADLFGRLRLEMKALGPAWGIVIGKAAQWAGLVDKLSQLDSRGPLSRRAPLRDLGDVDTAPMSSRTCRVMRFSNTIPANCAASTLETETGKVRAPGMLHICVACSPKMNNASPTRLSNLHGRTRRRSQSESPTHRCTPPSGTRSPYSWRALRGRGKQSLRVS